MRHLSVWHVYMFLRVVVRGGGMQDGDAAVKRRQVHGWNTPVHPSQDHLTFNTYY